MKRLPGCDCPDCALEQACVLKSMGENLGAELTRRLAAELSALQEAQLSEENTQAPLERDRNIKCATSLKEINALREELEYVYGWVYGSAAGLTWEDR